MQHRGVENASENVPQQTQVDSLKAQRGAELVLPAHLLGDRIDLLLTDMVMPGMSGKELSDRLTEQRPNLPVLFMSGYTDRYLGRDGIVSASVHFLKKPFRLAQLANQLRIILDKPPGDPSGT